MGHVVEIPFQSYRRLHQWYGSVSDQESYSARHAEVWFHIMKNHFSGGPKRIRIVAYDSVSGENVADSPASCVDLQYEGTLPCGETTQIYLMTVMTPDFASAQRSFSREVGESLEIGEPLDEITSPFGASILWDTSLIDTHTVIDVVEEWSREFWTDFRCEIVYGEVPQSGIGAPIPDAEIEKIWLEYPATETTCKVLLQAAPEQVGSIWSWVVSSGCEDVYCSENCIMLLMGFPVQMLSRLREQWVGLPFITTSHTP